MINQKIAMESARNLARIRTAQDAETSATSRREKSAWVVDANALTERKPTLRRLTTAENAETRARKERYASMGSANALSTSLCSAAENASI
jgi:hypothetical protein